MIDILVYGLLLKEKNPALVEAFIKDRERLLKAANLPKLDDSEYYRILAITIAFYDKHGKLPPDKTAVKEFAQHEKDLGVTEAWQTTMVEALKELNQIEEVRLKQCKTADVLIDQVVEQAKTEHIKFIAQRMVDIAVSGPSQIDDKGKKKNPNGPNDAKLFAFKELANDVEKGSEVAAGLFHENADKVAISLDNRLREETLEGRMKTGFSHVDQSIVIGRQALRYIGIAGMSGDGKTTVLNTMVYNFLKHGHNGLYLSFEHTPTEIWEFLTFIHTSHPDYAGYIPPSLNEWDLAKDPESGFKVTDEDIAHMGIVLNDIKTQKNLPGLLDVQDASKISTFDGFVAHLETFNEQYNYDFAVIDYLARLDVGGDARFREKEISNTIHKGQFLTRSFDNGRGLVLVTPMQVNREANKGARKEAEKNSEKDNAGAMKSTFYDINAIANFSEYQHDMDYIFSVFSDENMKNDFQMMMETLKVRKGKRPPSKMMQVNKKSGLVSVFTDAKRSTANFSPSMTADDEDEPQPAAPSTGEKTDLVVPGWDRP